MHHVHASGAAEDLPSLGAVHCCAGQKMNTGPNVRVGLLTMERVRLGDDDKNA
jgi:hypothetical protein